MNSRILIVEDEANYRTILEMLLADLGATLFFAEDGVKALEVLAAESVDLVVTDLNMPRMNGHALMEEIAKRPDRPPVVVMTAYGSIDVAVRAMRDGAIDFLEKPFDEARLKLTLARALSMSSLLTENRRLKDEFLVRYDFSSIIGTSESLLSTMKTAAKVANSESTVLVRGESGTGKELFARAIHENSRRRTGPFVAVNCAAIPEGLMEAELFGARAGAYTGAVKARKGRVEIAEKGTLFLDEIGDLPLALQAKLLRLIQEKSFAPLGAERDVNADVRFVFATHRDLQEHVKAGLFREDLFYRVSVVPLTLPPLRERGDDVILLAEAAAKRVAATLGRRPPPFSDLAKNALRAATWPGNVRELHNVIERAVILADGDRIETSDLALPEMTSTFAPNLTTSSITINDDAPTPFLLPKDGIVLEDVERALIEQALTRVRGNKSQAARLLGLTRATLRYRIEKLGVTDGEDVDKDAV